MYSRDNQYLHDLMKFFAIVGGLAIAFGAFVGLYNLMYMPMYSALLGILFIAVGGTCLMVAGGCFLKGVDDHVNK